MIHVEGSIEWENPDPIGDMIAAALPLLPPLVVPSMLAPRGEAWIVKPPGQRRKIVCHPDDEERIREALDTLTDPT